MNSKQSSAFHHLGEGLVFGSRPLILFLFAAITVAMVWFASQLKVDAGFKKQIPLDHEYMQTFLQYENEFGGANRVLVAVMARDGNMFTLPFMQTMEKVTNDVISIDEVDNSRVRSIFTPNVRFVEIVEDGFAGGNVIPATFAPNSGGFEATPEDFETIRSNIDKAGIVGRLVAKDFSGAMVWAELVSEDAGDGKLDYHKVANDLESIRQQYENDQVEIHIIGFAKVVGDISDGAKSVVMFFAIAILMTLVLLWFYAGSLRLALWPVLAAIVAVIWQLGILKLLGFGIDPMNILTPFLIFAIGVSHGVQMINSWLSERLFGGVEGSADALRAASGVSGEEAARRSFRRLLVPGSIALLSDCIGFVTILFINIRIIQELAITASIGVAVIIFTNLMLLPVLLSYTSFGKRYDKFRERRIRKAANPSAIWKMLASFSRPVPALIAIIIAAGLGWFGWQKAQDMKIGDSEAGVPELRQDSRFNQDARAITDHFGLGIDSIYVIAEAAKQSCTESYPVMEQIDRFAWHMKNIEGVNQVMTLPEISKIITAGWNEGNLRWRTIPRDQYVMRQSLANIETDTGLLNLGCSAMPIMIFLEDHKAETINRVVDAVKTYRDANHSYFGPDFRVEMQPLEEEADKNGQVFEDGRVNLRLATGNAGVMAATNEKVAEAQMPMLGWVYAAVIVLCLLTFLSLRATLAIVIPLALVSILANALMAHLNIGLKVNTLPVAALGVGIGVDYAIYIYSRMREFLDRGDTLYDAFYHALKLTGTAVLFTALTLAAGVGTWIFSELKFQADMGVLLAFMFVMNMIGALLLLPALLCWMGLRGGKKKAA